MDMAFTAFFCEDSLMIRRWHGIEDILMIMLVQIAVVVGMVDKASKMINYDLLANG